MKFSVNSAIEHVIFVDIRGVRVHMEECKMDDLNGVVVSNADC
jgi:hypothetical protein